MYGGVFGVEADFARGVRAFRVRERGEEFVVHINRKGGGGAALSLNDFYRYEIEPNVGVPRLELGTS